MFSNIESAASAAAPGRRLQGLTLLALALTLSLAACSSGRFATKPDAVVQAEARATAAEARAETAAAACTAPQPLAPPVCAAAPSGEAIARMLAYADRVRLIAPADLGQEAARLVDTGAPEVQMQLALVLSQQRQMPELVRAQELLARVLGNGSAEAQALHPLARLLASRYGEQRRVEEQFERQNQQVRDVQRRLDQTNERLEALKAIERSLSTRQPAASAPAAAAPSPRRTTP